MYPPLLRTIAVDLYNRAKAKQKKLEAKTNPKPKERSEFPYLPELNNDELTRVKYARKIYIDPGKHNILTCLDSKTGKIYKYTRTQYLKDTKRPKMRLCIERFKNHMRIPALERTIKASSKSCEDFFTYLEQRQAVADKLYERYGAEEFRRFQWYSYINKTRASDRLLNQMTKRYGKYPILIIGDWGAHPNALKHNAPTPGIGMKRVLSRQFTVYSIDEFRTSKLHHQTEGITDTLRTVGADGRIKRINQILAFKGVHERLNYINRDKNSVFNMQKLTEHYLTHKTRPERYTRGTILE
jgi:hypothetical protein